MLVFVRIIQVLYYIIPYKAMQYYELSEIKHWLQFSVDLFCFSQIY